MEIDGVSGGPIIQRLIQGRSLGVRWSRNREAGVMEEPGIRILDAVSAVARPIPARDKGRRKKSAVWTITTAV